MPAPPARFHGRSVRGTAALAMMVAMILGTSCNLFMGYGTQPSQSGASSESAASTPASKAPSSGGKSSQGSIPSIGPCQPAPEWLVTVLQAGVAVHGATLSEVYVGEAWDFTSGPAAVMSADYVPAWWIVAKINGAGVRPEVVVWVTNRTGVAKTGTILGANPSSLRYSKFGQGGSNPIQGSGQAQLLACLTPIPES
jgi:hypothetical protein